MRVQCYAEVLEPGLRQPSSSPKRRELHCCLRLCLSQLHVVVNHKLPLLHGCAAALCKPDGSQGDLALESCLVLSYLVTMTMRELAAALPYSFPHCRFSDDLFLAISPVRSELVCATCSHMDCFSPLSHNASPLANPLRIFFPKDLYTGLPPRGRIDNVKL